MVTLYGPPESEVGAESDLVVSSNDAHIIGYLVTGGCEPASGSIAKAKPTSCRENHVIRQFAVTLDAHTRCGKKARADAMQRGSIHGQTESIDGCGTHEIRAAYCIGLGE